MTGMSHQEPRKESYTFTASLWKYQGHASWYFFTVSQEVSQRIREHHHQHARGWGSLPVAVSLGTSSWETSLFPEGKSKCYLLPVKAAIRKAENLSVQEPRNITLHVLHTPSR